MIPETNKYDLAGYLEVRFKKSQPMGISGPSILLVDNEEDVEIRVDIRTDLQYMLKDRIKLIDKVGRFLPMYPFGYIGLLYERKEKESFEDYLERAKSDPKGVAHSLGLRVFTDYEKAMKELGILRVDPKYGRSIYFYDKRQQTKDEEENLLDDLTEN